MNIAEEMREHLEKKLLPFWKNLKDEEYGGFYGFMDAEGKTDRQAVKGCILNSRILWFFFAGPGMEGICGSRLSLFEGALPGQAAGRCLLVRDL